MVEVAQRKEKRTNGIRIKLPILAGCMLCKSFHTYNLLLDERMLPQLKIFTLSILNAIVPCLHRMLCTDSKIAAHSVDESICRLFAVQQNI